MSNTEGPTVPDNVFNSNSLPSKTILFFCEFALFDMLITLMSVYDLKFFNNINSKVLRQKDLNEVLNLITQHFSLDLKNIQKKRLKALLPELLKRINTFIDIEDDIEWITSDDFICTDIDNLLILKDKILNIKEISILLNKCKWTKDDIDNCLKQYIIEKSIKFKDIGPALRVALTQNKFSRYSYCYI